MYSFATALVTRGYFFWNSGIIQNETVQLLGMISVDNKLKKKNTKTSSNTLTNEFVRGKK